MEEDKEHNEIKMIERFVDFRDKNVLEIGCGDGSYSTLLSHNAHKYVAIDPDKQRIKEAQSLKSNVDFRIGTGETLEFKDSSFHVVLFTLSLHHHQNSCLALKEANRVLKEDGKLVILEPMAGGELQQILYLFNDETVVLAETLKVIKKSDFELENQETFCSTITFHNQEELYSHPFDRTTIHPNDRDRILKKCQQLKGTIIDDQPIHLQAKMQILSLRKKQL